jgi:hypothetical protein
VFWGCTHEQLVLANSQSLFMVLNTTFTNISVISWQSVLLVEETGVNHQSVASHWQALSHNVVSSMPRLSGIPTHISVYRCIDTSVVVIVHSVASCLSLHHFPLLFIFVDMWIQEVQDSGF